MCDIPSIDLTDIGRVCLKIRLEQELIPDDLWNFRLGERKPHTRHRHLTQAPIWKNKRCITSELGHLFNGYHNFELSTAYGRWEERIGERDIFCVMIVFSILPQVVIEKSPDYETALNFFKKMREYSWDTNAEFIRQGTPDRIILTLSRPLPIPELKASKKTEVLPKITLARKQFALVS